MTFAFRAILALSLGIVACAPSSSGAAGSSPSAAASKEKRCESAATQLETENCYVDAAVKSRAKVQHVFHQTLRAAMALGKEFDDSSLAKRLNSSQAEWLRYSQSQCSFEGGSSFGGSGTGILEAACHYRLNLERLAELEAAGKLLIRGR